MSRYTVAHYVLPDHLLELARRADETPTHVRPDDARRIAALMLTHLPPDDPALIRRRHIAVEHERAVRSPRGPKDRRSEVRTVTELGRSVATSQDDGPGVGTPRPSSHPIRTTGGGAQMSLAQDDWDRQHQPRVTTPSGGAR